MVEPGKVLKILLVEDNPDDVVIMQKALKSSNVIGQLSVVRDGQEAVDFLFHHGRFQDPATNPTPALILLDINLPKLSGVEVLARLKQEPHLRRIPVVMLTSSKRDEDVVRSYENGCNSFLQKPVEFDRFVELVRQIGLYWATLNVKPPSDA